MRISGYGSGHSGQQQSGDRAAAFKRQHSIGQRVKGRILRRDACGLYWVAVGGAELLARLEVQVAPGDELLFIVRALDPEILLQTLPQGSAAVDLPGLAQRFRAAREVFETTDPALLPSLCSLPPQPAVRREAFMSAIGQRPEAEERLARALDILAQLNASLPEQSGAQALYEPWLLPCLRRSEGFRRAGGELVLSGSSGQCGGVDIRLGNTPDGPRLSLAAEAPEHSGALQVELFALAREVHGRDPVLLGPTRLRPNALGGALGELFSHSSAWSAGGLNARV